METAVEILTQMVEDTGGSVQYDVKEEGYVICYLHRTLFIPQEAVYGLEYAGELRKFIANRVSDLKEKAVKDLKDSIVWDVELPEASADEDN